MVPLLMVNVPVASVEEVAAAAFNCNVAFPEPDEGLTEKPFPETVACHEMLLVDKLMVCVPPSCEKDTEVGLALMNGSSSQPARHTSPKRIRRGGDKFFHTTKTSNKPVWLLLLATKQDLYQLKTVANRMCDL